MEEIDYNFLLRNTMIATSTVILDSLEIKQLNFNKDRGAEDYALWLKLLKKYVHQKI